MQARPHKLSRRQRKEYRWDFLAENASRALELCAHMRINPVVARVLANRGYTLGHKDLDSFIRPALATLHDPGLLCDIDSAVDRIVHAISHGEKITVYGDYDTDGATSTALLLRLFRYFSIEAGYYIPHRIDEGYGLNCPAIDQIADSGCNLLITVDNGISAVDEIAHANERGLDVIVTDHHQPGPKLPDAVAVVDPSRHDCAYPNKHLTGVGVAFKLAHALLKKMRVTPARATPFLRSLLDLVAVGTIADIAELTGENRVLVKHGLEQIMHSSNAGIVGLKRALEMDGRPVTTRKVGFQIAPRLNAAGRTDHAWVCVDLLTTNSEERVREIVGQLEEANRERRSVEDRILEQSLLFVERELDSADRVLVIEGEDWHVGVIGIVASRIVDVFDRPVIVISKSGCAAKGSARSVKGFNIHEALVACSEHLLAFGGHPFAAGLQLHTDKISEFRRSINAYAAERLDDHYLQPSLTIDTSIEVEELNHELIAGLEFLEPYGPANAAPVFSLSGLRLAGPPKIVGANHLKVQFSRNGRCVSAIGFNMGDRCSYLAGGKGKTIDVAFVPVWNDYYMPGQVELELKDIKINRAN